MINPSLQLDLENALKSYLTGISVINSAPIYAAHGTEKAPDGTYLAIRAEPPDWYALGGYNATVLVQFICATQVSDPDARNAADAAHALRTGALIDLLSMQRFNEIKAALNPPAFPPDMRPWAGLGFDAWEQDASVSDAPTETQVVTTLPYEFVVHLEV
jgi:hypothetical protein